MSGTMYYLLITLLLTAVSCLDYSNLLKELSEKGLVSERMKRSIHQAGMPTWQGGCPLAMTSHSVSKRSIDNHQSAEHVLSIISDMTDEFGYSEALRRIRRSIDFRQLDCIDGWTPCESTRKYRTIDGRCNNLDNPTWGAGLIPHLRYAPPAYSDQVGTPRLYGTDGSCLPTAREVSKAMHMSSHDKMKMSHKHSHMLMLWGQFLDHDLTLTPHRQTPFSCCTYEGVWRDSRRTSKCKPQAESLVSRSLRALRARGRTAASIAATQRTLSDSMCMALEVNDDTFGVGHTCMDFQRSVAVPANNCQLGHREQINQATAFIDGSQIYGSTDTLAWDLRLRVNGSLNTSGHNFLPSEDEASKNLYTDCVTDSNAEHCFKAGDERVNIQPGLASIHTLFMNEHNRIAQELLEQLPASVSAQTPQAIDEFVYQESRRIVGAMLQHITYSEFLPILLGERNMFRYGLKNNKIRRSPVKYSAAHQPSIRNEFATFAFRVGHSLIPEGLVPLNSAYVRHSTAMHKFDNMFMNPHLLYQYGVGDVLRGVISEPVKQPGPHVNHDLERLFRHSNRSAGGLDLIAVNIQRGRDHGIPSYTAMRRNCRLRVPSNFSELEMSEEIKNKLAQIYRSVHDIDAWTGAVSEIMEAGATVGKLNACIIGRQFRSLRRGDRFWYEFQEPNVGFSNGQLEEIYKITLARVLCDNLNMATVQPKVFYLVQRDQIENQRVNCTDIPKLNLDRWFTK